MSCRNSGLAPLPLRGGDGSDDHIHCCDNGILHAMSMHFILNAIWYKPPNVLPVSIRQQWAQRKKGGRSHPVKDRQCADLVQNKHNAIDTVGELPEHSTLPHSSLDIAYAFGQTFVISPGPGLVVNFHLSWLWLAFCKSECLPLHTLVSLTCQPLAKMTLHTLPPLKSLDLPFVSLFSQHDLARAVGTCQHIIIADFRVACLCRTDCTITYTNASYMHIQSSCCILCIFHVRPHANNLLTKTLS